MYISFLSGILKLGGSLELPTTKKPLNGYPVAILLHGWNGSKDSKNAKIVG